MKNEMIMFKKKFCLITTNEKNNVYIVYIMCSVPHITSTIGNFQFGALLNNLCVMSSNLNNILLNADLHAVGSFIAPKNFKII